MNSLARLHEALTTDPQRQSLGFSDDLRTAQDELLLAETDYARRVLVRDWIARHQPCVFGRSAATHDQIEICVLTAEDLTKDDRFIRDRIQKARLAWLRAARRGEKSAFVLLAVSPDLVLARPDASLMRFAQRLAELYLVREAVDVDVIHLEQIYLRVPTRNDSRDSRWSAGINVFAAAGDRRWWQDHRIPGGLAFSVNSVGHMVRSAQVSKVFRTVGGELGVDLEAGAGASVRSLPHALTLAMDTINNATESISGKATWLVAMDPSAARDLPACPVDLPPRLSGKSHCEYAGAYHTDVTIPSSYFRDDIERPADVGSMNLDLTYLFHDSVDNPAFRTMGEGELITASGRQTLDLLQFVPYSRTAKSIPESCDENEFLELEAELSQLEGDMS